MSNRRAPPAGLDCESASSNSANVNFEVQIGSVSSTTLDMVKSPSGTDGGFPRRVEKCFSHEPFLSSGVPESIDRVLSFLPLISFTIFQAVNIITDDVFAGERSLLYLLNAGLK